ncbi:putative CCR4-associated factor 11 [Ananas comosus]|uniref:Putative CCR4-associated factor 11 n=1 Tax=Ananas comosus TaxID=4615 RepID=A0A199URJ9_ANACO|nr:putative CCR4-associated factor 11 [Ananas comosus]
MATGVVEVRQVWAENADYEFSLIRSVVCCGRFCFAAFDTEYPGTIYIHTPDVDPRGLSPTQRYELLKLNVDALHIVQLGLALSDAAGRLPDLGTCGAFRYGIDFGALRCYGLDLRRFAELLASSGLLGPAAGMIWVTFHGAYDFGYVVKALLGGRRLPPRMDDFLALVRYYFGPPESSPN